MADTKLAVPPYGTECMSCGCNVYKPAPRLCRNASAHEIAGLAAPPVAEEATPVLNAFIAMVNADHDDVIPVSREIGCRMRDEVARLRHAATPPPTREAAVELPPRPKPMASDDTNFFRSRAEWIHYARALEARIAQLEAELAALKAVPK